MYDDINKLFCKMKKMSARLTDRSIFSSFTSVYCFCVYKLSVALLFDGSLFDRHRFNRFQHCRRRLYTEKEKKMKRKREKKKKRNDLIDEFFLSLQLFHDNRLHLKKNIFQLQFIIWLLA